MPYYTDAVYHLYTVVHPLRLSRTRL